MKKFICEVSFSKENNLYVIDFVDDESCEVLEYKYENCLDDCLIDLYEFERSCYDKYCSNFDIIKIRIRDLQFGL